MDLIKDLFKGDKVIWIIFLFLCLISIVEVFSAASTLTYKSGDHWGPITQHSVILMVGACIVVLVHNIPCKWFRVLPFFLLPISAVLLVFVMGMGIITGDRVNGAARWMTFFGIQFQPSELAKMADSSDYPNIVSVSASNDYTAFTVTLSTDTVGLQESIMVMAFYMYGGMYNAFNGTPADNVSVQFVNQSGTVLESANSRDMQ